MAKMHADELDTSVALAQQLIAEQQPQWSDLAIRPVASTGTSNAMFRLGDDLVIRLPLQPSSEANVRKEHTWLPILASLLPFAIPTAVAVGEPTEAYPMPWTVCRWLPGVDGTDGNFDQEQTAKDLARFLRSLQAISTADAPKPNDHPTSRGADLHLRADLTRRAIDACRAHFDPADLHALWNDALAAPTFGPGAVWIHGDIASGNLLFADRRLSAVIDWSPMGVGDPACELIVAWEMFHQPARELFLDELHIDNAMLRRARGWTLSTAVMALPYYEHTNKFMFDQAAAKLTVLLATC